MPPEALRAALADRALAEIPKLLTQLDRTPVSPTYGCFDRSYWHYRMVDFPCGMSQEFVLPLALAWALDRPGNPYFHAPAIRSWVEAGIRYAAAAAHPDGSCDDYYPFERAAGAAAFSLFAMLEAIEITGLALDAETEAFLIRRGLWLGAHRESGRLSNHEALIVSCLDRLGARFGRERFAAFERERLSRLLCWQSEEGWFDEYGGADLGYLSLTIGLLADLDRRRPELALRPALAAAIGFFAHFVHPDGTVGGEYSSRGTLNFFPHGFEIAGRWLPQALAINTRALRPLAEGRAPCYSDDKIVGHHVWSWLFAHRDFVRERPVEEPVTEGRRWFEGAGLLVERRGDTALFAAPRRGGVFKLFVGERLVASDTGPTLQVGGKGRVAVSHIEGPVELSLGADAIVVSGRMAWAKSARLTPAKNVVLRLVMITIGRFHPDLVRKLLQRLLVTGRKDAPFRFRRTLARTGAVWSVADEITADEGWGSVRAAGIGGFQTSTTTIMARVFQIDQLQPWLDLGGRLPGLGPDEALRHSRTLTVPEP